MKNNNSADNRLIPEAYLNSFNSLIKIEKVMPLESLSRSLIPIYLLLTYRIYLEIYTEIGNIEKSSLLELAY